MTSLVTDSAAIRGYRRIHLPTDFSAAADRSLEVALTLAADDGHIDLAHFWKPLARWNPPGDATTTLEVGAAIDIAGAERCSRHAGCSPTIGLRSSEGHPYTRIIDSSESDGCELVALGTHGHRGYRLHMLGSHAEATVRHARCSVLVTPA